MSHTHQLSQTENHFLEAAIFSFRQVSQNFSGKCPTTSPLFPTQAAVDDDEDHKVQVKKLTKRSVHDLIDTFMAYLVGKNFVA